MASDGGAGGTGLFSYSKEKPPGSLSAKTKTSDVLKHFPMARPAYASEGQHIQLLSNHFYVKFNAHDVIFYNYNVSILSHEDSGVNAVVASKGIGRKVLDKLYQIYTAEFNGKEFAYDGDKNLFTVGPLPRNNLVFTVVMDDSSTRSSGGRQGNGSPSEGSQKRPRRSHFAKTYEVNISFAAKIPLKSIALALKGIESDHTQDALRVLDIILRQQQAKRGCLLVKQSYFLDDPTNLVGLGGGVSSCSGFHSSFRTTRAGLSLNMDVSTTMIVTPGPVIDFLLANQNVQDIRKIDWVKAKSMLKNLKIKTQHTNMEFRIRGISELPCNQLLFSRRVINSNGETQMVEVTVYDYFREIQNIELTWSAHVPCLDVGKPKRPNYLPVELCHLISLQRYTKALSSQQRASFVEKCRQKPSQRMKVVTNAVENNRCDEDAMLSSCGLDIGTQLTKLEGRVLQAPILKVGNQEVCVPQNGRWNFNQKRLLQPIQIDRRWAIVKFSAQCNLSYLSRELINCARHKGIQMERPYALLEEDREWIRSNPLVRVQRMFEKIIANLPGRPQFLLCVLPERKTCDIYGPWKKKSLIEMGIITQCISPTKINDQYLTNVLLKINSKLGGINSLLAIEFTPSIPLVNKIPTMIVGMDVCHSSPHSDSPSVVAVVGSRQWPLISRYRASVRTQSPKLEMIDCLYKPVEGEEEDGEIKDGGMIRELLIDFYETSNGMKPSQIIIFRDGVSESQFNQVLSVELPQIIKALEHLGISTLPKFTVIVAQKNHHTRFFNAGASENVPPGTVVDTTVVHPRNYDFFMCAHAGRIGTSRPVHYNVLLDEIGFSPDDVQKFVHSLSYVYQRGTTAVSMAPNHLWQGFLSAPEMLKHQGFGFLRLECSEASVTPVCYAHLAALQASQIMKVEGHEDYPEFPRMHENVCKSMFFC